MKKEKLYKSIIAGWQDAGWLYVGEFWLIRGSVALQVIRSAGGGMEIWKGKKLICKYA